MKKIILPALITFLLVSCYKESKLLVNADFRATVQDDNHTAPVRLVLENNSTGADFYRWTFEGGSPSSSNDKTPGTVTYAKAGTYSITLEAWNDYEQGTKTFSFSVDSAVTVSFNPEIRLNDFAPAIIDIRNATQGASTFRWTFEGGSPETSTDRHPSGIRFEEGGEYKITLIAGNGREEFEVSKTITLRPSIAVDFEVEPSFDDFDYEAPFIATLINKTTGGLAYEWTINGGVVQDKNAENTSIQISDPGVYTIALEGDNGKEKKTTVKTVTVKRNTNLYTMTNVKFGIKSAASTVGAFYSLKQRSIIPQNTVTENNGKDIDIVFFGINATFEKCYFTSPDLAANAGFYSVPGATVTYFVHAIDTPGLTFSSSDFDAMTDDTLLRTLNIKAASNTTSWFIAYPVPRIVLFETASGRKGAIKIKSFVSEQAQSYILTDIKFQKENVQ